MRQWYPEPSFITAEGFKAKSATGKDARDKAWRKHAQALQGPLPAESHEVHSVPPAQTVTTRGTRLTRGGLV